MSAQDKANELKSHYGYNLAIEVCNEVIDVIERCEPQGGDYEIHKYLKYWESIRSLIK